jgi:hypothetical protein
MKRAGKPPDNAFSCAIAFLGIVVIYVAVIGYRFWQFKRLQRALFKTSKPSHIVLASLQKSYQACEDATSGTLLIPMGYRLSLTILLLAYHAMIGVSLLTLFGSSRPQLRQPMAQQALCMLGP